MSCLHGNCQHINTGEVEVKGREREGVQLEKKKNRGEGRKLGQVSQSQAEPFEGLALDLIELRLKWARVSGGPYDCSSGRLSSDAGQRG